MMNIRYTGLVIVLFYIFAPLDLLAQKHDYHWLYGYNPGGTNSAFRNADIDFNYTPPHVDPSNTPINFNLSSAAMSDSAGTLLFYTNGIALYNAAHQLIENGDTINPGEWWQSSINMGYAHFFGGFTLPYPNHPDEYVFFHAGLVYDDDSSYVRENVFYYTLIDMAANNGKGKVLLKNQILLEGDLGWPAACKHGNGRDWWITIYDLGNPEQQTFLLSPTGITGPFTQTIGPVFPERENIGKCVFSPDGNTYIRHDGNNGPRIMRFNRCTGLFSNLRLLPYPENTAVFSWSAAISPDSRFLYLSKPTVVWSLDLQVTNPLVSYLDTLARYNGSYCPEPWSTRFFAMQEAPDGKIYASNYENSSRCMNVIGQPLLPGLAADVAFGGFELPIWNGITSSHFPHYRLGASEGSPCDTLNLQAPEGGFYTSPYPAQTLAEQRGSADDYVIWPVVPGEPSEAARREEQEYGDLKKVIYRQWLHRNDPDVRAVPQQTTPIKKHK